LLSKKELKYLWELWRRNFSNEFKNQADPLSNPVTDEEMNLRNGIVAKCKLWLRYIVLAEAGGLLPDEEMKKENMSSVAKAIDDLNWGLMVSEFAKREKK
jgi:hypothetical protein